LKNQNFKHLTIKVKLRIEIILVSKINNSYSYKNCWSSKLTINFKKKIKLGLNVGIIEFTNLELIITNNCIT